MANYAKYGIVVAIIIGVVCGSVFGALEDADRSVPGLSFPYGRGLVSSSMEDSIWDEKDLKVDNELQLARLLLVAPRFYHSKRNSELINSLLGLPKNMHNAGK